MGAVHERRLRPECGGHRHPFLQASLSRSPEERRRLETARAWGEPPSILDGRVPAEEHVYHYDKRGRVKRVEVIREPRWTANDRQLAEALTMLDGLRCSGCGHSLAETTDPGWVGVVEADTCYACRAKSIVDRDLERVHEKDPKPAPGRPIWSDGRLPWVRAATAEDLVGRVRPE